MAETENNASATRNCPRCGAELPPGLPPDRCPACLRKTSMGSPRAPGPGGTIVVSSAQVVSQSLPQPGEQLGHYRIIRPLGSGGMGTVFEAEDLETGRRIALKLLSRALDSPDARQRFFREGRLAASINHPNSVYVFGTGEIGGTPVIAMELVPGGTLHDRVSSLGPLPPAEAVDAILQIIAGLEAAARVGILHRDIKPSNCFLDLDGTIKIGDFGLSISTTLHAEPSLTVSGAFLGTPIFSSPEQLRGENLTVRSDIYSVGATLFWLLTGRTPFQAQNVVALIAAVFEQPAPSPQTLCPAIPAGLAKVARRCLQKQPDQRFQDYAELRQALAPFSSTALVPARLVPRFVAGVLDVALLHMLSLAAFLPVGGNPLEWQNLTAQRPGKWLALFLGAACGSVLYYALLEGFCGATAGKALCRLRVAGLDRNVPGFRRALVRALIYALLPSLPAWAIARGNPVALQAAGPAQFAMQVSSLVLLLLIFCTMRRRNGFAALHDLLTKTRVIAHVTLPSRPVLSAAESPSPAGEPRAAIGPYAVLETLEASADGAWLLGYDQRLLRQVWIHRVPPGTPPLPVPWRNLGRAGRLRWLTGRRSADENWDAFEAVVGQPLTRLIQDPQPWTQVRYWLHDLAAEISAAEKDGTLPPMLTLDRVWITADGRAKLLDFPAPGLAALPFSSGEAGGCARENQENKGTPLPGPLPAPSSRGEGMDQRAGGASAHGPAAAPDAYSLSPRGTSGERAGERGSLSSDSDKVAGSPPPLPRKENPQRFLAEVAAAALEGGPEAAAKPPAEIAVPLPLHAREFLKSLPRFPDTGAFALALKQLLPRPAVVTRSRRLVVLGGCIALPVLAACGTALGLFFFQRWDQSNPGLVPLSNLLQQRSILRRWSQLPNLPTDNHFAVYIATHYRNVITNEALWSTPTARNLIQGQDRQFAEESLARHPAPAENEIAQANAALAPYLPKPDAFELSKHLSFPLMVAGGALVLLVCLPALLAALCRGGLILRLAGVAFVRPNGQRASRVRLFGRAFLAWSPVLLGMILLMKLPPEHSPVFEALAYGLTGALAILSVALPERGLPDRLAGVWPVPR